MKRSLAAVLIGLAQFGLAGQASAASCVGYNLSDPARIGSASTDDFTLGGASATACAVSTGNPQQANGTAGGSHPQFVGLPFTTSYHDDAPATSNWIKIAAHGGSGSVSNTGTSIDGLGLSLTATNLGSNQKSGDWTLGWTGGPGALDLLFTMHGGNTFGAFLFDDVVFGPGPDSETGTWKIEWHNNGGQFPGYSNLVLWARLGTEPIVTACVGEACNPTEPEVPVPAPGTLAALGAGLLALRLAGRRARKS